MCVTDPCVLCGVRQRIPTLNSEFLPLCGVRQRIPTLHQEQCAQFCSKDELWEAAKEEEMKIPWKEAQEGLPVPEDQYQERFWRRRLDGIGLDTSSKTVQ
jgi:hypothetical protein